MAVNNKLVALLNIYLLLSISPIDASRVKMFNRAMAESGVEELVSEMKKDANINTVNSANPEFIDGDIFFDARSNTSWFNFEIRPLSGQESVDDATHTASAAEHLVKNAFPAMLGDLQYEDDVSSSDREMWWKCFTSTQPHILSLIQRIKNGEEGRESNTITSVMSSFGRILGNSDCGLNGGPTSLVEGDTAIPKPPEVSQVDKESVVRRFGDALRQESLFRSLESTKQLEAAVAKVKETWYMAKTGLEEERVDLSTRMQGIEVGSFLAEKQRSTFDSSLLTTTSRTNPSSKLHPFSSEPYVSPRNDSVVARTANISKQALLEMHSLKARGVFGDFASLFSPAEGRADLCPWFHTFRYFVENSAAAVYSYYGGNPAETNIMRALIGNQLEYVCPALNTGWTLLKSVYHIGVPQMIGYGDLNVVAFIAMEVAILYFFMMLMIIGKVGFLLKLWDMFIVGPFKKSSEWIRNMVNPDTHLVPRLAAKLASMVLGAGGTVLSMLPRLGVPVLSLLMSVLMATRGLVFAEQLGAAVTSAVATMQVEYNASFTGQFSSLWGQIW